MKRLVKLIADNQYLPKIEIIANITLGKYDTLDQANDAKSRLANELHQVLRNSGYSVTEIKFKD